MPAFDELTLKVNGQPLSGWTDIRVTRSIERFPSDFEIEMTERYPSKRGVFQILPGDACLVSLGDDLVLTGFVDGVKPSLSPGNHTIKVYGRNKCSDLVDASAEWPGGQIAGASAFEIAHNLAFNFGLDVEAVHEDASLPIPQYNLAFGESSYDIIERTCRMRGLLAYDTPEGKLRLARAAFVRTAASAISEGKNVQACTADYRLDGRFSEYVVLQMSRDVFSDVGEMGYRLATAKDPGVRRHRIKYIVAEASYSNQVQAQVRADWEYRRRAGRSATVHVTVDSWRDGDGALWEPNTLAAVHLPSMYLVNKYWLISEVSYKRNGQAGTTCDLTLMPPEAFIVQPPNLPNYADIRKALQDTPLGDDAPRPEIIAPGYATEEGLPLTLKKLLNP